MLRPLLLALALPGAAAAQAPKEFFGLKAGVTRSAYLGTSSSPHFRPHGGLFINLYLSKRLSLAPELLYTVKGGERDALFGGTRPAPVQEELHYLEVPLLLQAKARSFFVEAGPQVGILISAASSDPAGISAPTNLTYYNTLDLGYAVGVGYQAPFGLLAGLRYTGGLLNVEAERSATRQTAAVYNAAGQLYVGYVLSRW